VAEVLMDSASDQAAGVPYWDLLRGDEGALH